MLFENQTTFFYGYKLHRAYIFLVTKQLIGKSKVH